MTIFERDALTTRHMTVAPSTRRISNSAPFGGYRKVVSPTSQIEVPVPSVQDLECAAHRNNIASRMDRRHLQDAGHVEFDS